MKVDILGIPMDHVTMDQAIQRAQAYFQDGNTHMVFTPNPEIILLAQDNLALTEALKQADMLLPDGIGVVIASRLLKRPLPERVPGYDFIGRLLKTDKTFYLFGGKPGVAEKAAHRLEQQGVAVVGFHHGYFSEDGDIIRDINQKQPDVLLVCLGAPRQELWIQNNRHHLKTSLCIGAGGTIDGLAGEVKRAPEIYQKLNIEWLYRGLKQPSRLPRLLQLPKFLWKVICSRGGKNK